MIGDTTAMLSLQKGVPLAYNRDFQEDKRIVFHADDTLAGSLEALGALLASAEFAPPEPSPWVGALDLAEALVARGVPFREAHHAVGRVVVALNAASRTLTDAVLEDLTGIDDRFVAADLETAHATTSVERRLSPGGGSHVSVRAQLDRLGELLD